MKRCLGMEEIGEGSEKVKVMVPFHHYHILVTFTLTPDLLHRPNKIGFLSLLRRQQRSGSLCSVARK